MIAIKKAQSESFVARMDHRALRPRSDLEKLRKNYLNALAKLVLSMNDIFDRFSSFERIGFLFAGNSWNALFQKMTRSRHVFSEENFA